MEDKTHKMILTCPVCSSRYLVSPGAIGPTGRRVRCVQCAHEWQAEAEEGLDEELFAEEEDFTDEEVSFETVDDSDMGDNPVDETVDMPQAVDDDAQDFQSILRKEIEASPIPEGVKPSPQDSVLPDLTKKKKSFKLPAGDPFWGYVAAACFYLVVFGAFLMLHPQISRAWPPSNLLYNLVGLKPVPAGEGLSLEELRAEQKDGAILLSGTVVNLKESDLTVPPIMASAVDDAGKTIDHILIPPPTARLKGEGTVPFTATYAKMPDGATNITFAFTYVKVKEKQEVPKQEVQEEPQGHAEHETSH